MSDESKAVILAGAFSVPAMPSLPELEAMHKTAEMLYGSCFIPKALVPKVLPAGVKQEDTIPELKRLSVANALGAMLKGREMGFGPMEALNSVWASPDGSLRMWSQTMMALMLKRGFRMEWKHIGPDYAELYAKRPDNGMEVTRRWDLDDTKKFFGSIKPDSNWAKDPEDMNVARAIARVFRSIASDITGGPVYDPREVIDVDSADAEDQKRVDRLSGGMGDFKVGLKAKPEAPPETPTVEVKPPEPLPQPTPAAAPPPEPKPEPVAEYWVCSIAVKDDGKVTLTPVPGEKPQRVQDAATARAQEIADLTGVAHAVAMTLDGKFSERVATCDPSEAPPPVLAPAPPPAPSAAPAQAPPAEPESKVQALGAPVKNRMKKLAEDMAIPWPTASKMFKAFVGGYLGVAFKSVPDDPMQWLEPVEELEYCIGNDVNEFRSGPEPAGKLCRQRRADLLAYIATQWKDPAVQTLVLSVARKYNNTPREFQAFVEFQGLNSPKELQGFVEAKGLDFCATKDAYAFFRALKITREAGVLPALAKAHNLTLSDIVAQIETRGLKCKLEESDPATVERAIKGYALAVKEQASAVPPEPAPTPATEAPKGGSGPAASNGPTEPERDDLFSDWK